MVLISPTNLIAALGWLQIFGKENNKVESKAEIAKQGEETSWKKS